MLWNVAQINAEPSIPEDLAALSIERNQAFLRVGGIANDGEQIQTIAKRDGRRSPADGNPPRKTFALGRPLRWQIGLSGSAITRGTAPLGPVSGSQRVRPDNRP